MIEYRKLNKENPRVYELVIIRINSNTNTNNNHGGSANCKTNSKCNFQQLFRR